VLFQVDKDGGPACPVAKGHAIADLDKACFVSYRLTWLSQFSQSYHMITAEVPQDQGSGTGAANFDGKHYRLDWAALNDCLV
jgi:hypothetical protein